MKPIYIILIIIAIVIIYYSYRTQHFINSSINSSLNLTVNSSVSNTDYYEEVISENPKIIYLHNFLNSKQSEHFIELGEKLKKPSTIDSKESPTTLKQDVRSSKSAHIGKSTDEIVKQVEELASKYMNTDTNHIEPLQVVVYEKGP